MQRLIRAALLAAAAAAPAAALQEPGQPTFRLEANYVRVDLYAMVGETAVDDLRPDEIELFEDGAPQTIAAFEHVKVAQSVAPELRRDPESPSRSREMAADPRARVLVIFLDTVNVQMEGSYHMRKPLVDLVERAVGDEDLVAVMHPRMSARELTLGRKIDVIKGVLTEQWPWGEKARETQLDPVEEDWLYCYGPGDTFEEMRARRRENMTLDSLADLVRHLRGLRDERKAVLLVTEGWRLFRENQRLAAVKKGEQPPTGPGIFVGPTGKLQRHNPREQGYVSQADCDAARMELALTDNSNRVRELIGDANRANVSFYPVDPRGLQATDTPGVLHTSAADMQRSASRLKAQIEQLREIASGTDGLPVVNTNDLQRGVRRIISDLTSYYLLGYYSTNTRYDGRFRTITVKVKRPGVQVRARRGYRALTREEAATLQAARSAAAVAASPQPVAVSSILHRPDEIVNPVNLASLRHAVLWKRGPSTGRNYVATEDPRLRRTERARVEHAAPAEGPATARMLDAAGKPMAVPVQVSERPDPSGNFRWLVADVTLAPLAPGEYAIEVAVGDLTVRTPFQIVP
jgi:VWFA-related protein